MRAWYVFLAGWQAGGGWFLDGLGQLSDFAGEDFFHIFYFFYYPE